MASCPFVPLRSKILRRKASRFFVAQRAFRVKNHPQGFAALSGPSRTNTLRRKASCPFVPLRGKSLCRMASCPFVPLRSKILRRKASRFFVAQRAFRVKNHPQGFAALSGPSRTNTLRRKASCSFVPLRGKSLCRMAALKALSWKSTPLKKSPQTTSFPQLRKKAAHYLPIFAPIKKETKTVQPPKPKTL